MNQTVTEKLIAADGLNVPLTAVDGCVLSARLFDASSSDRPQVVAIINAGAGLRQTYYARFARFLGDSGVPTLTYDYRGIGASRPADLRGFEASVEDWGSKDCAAALEWMRNNFPESKLALIGHSVGSLVPGFVSNSPLIANMLLIGGHTGFWRDYRAGVRWPMYLIWHRLMPALAELFGYFPGHLFGLDDLPLGVARQWAERRRPELWWNVSSLERVEEVRAQFSAYTANILMLRFTDDVFATAAASRRLERLYSGCAFSERVLDPADTQGKRTGHFGFFHKSHVGLWKECRDWLRTWQPLSR